MTEQAGTATEGGANGAFRFTRTGDLSSSLPVNYTVGGSATSAADYTALTVTFGIGASTVDVFVAAPADNAAEGDETVAVATPSAPGYALGSSAATVTIADAPVVSVSAPGNASEDGTAAAFLFTRTGGDLSSALIVTYSVGGTATPGTDYTALSGSVTFAAGSATADATVRRSRTARRTTARRSWSPSRAGRVRPPR